MADQTVDGAGLPKPTGQDESGVARGDSAKVAAETGRRLNDPGRRLTVPGFARWPERTSPTQQGKQLRIRTPRAVQAHFEPSADRQSVVEAVRASNVGRLAELAPIRVGRMAMNPFAFLRGTAGLMAADLAETQVSGVVTQICGDAHAANFGLYGDAKGSVVIDINDFDETVFGPWEWDLKRLAASIVLAGREAGVAEDICRGAAFDAAGAYRRTMRLLAKMPALDAWQAIPDEELVSHTDAKELLGTLTRVSAKARRNTSARFAAKNTRRLADGGFVFTDAPPVLRRVPDKEAEAVAASLAEYLGTLPADRLPLLARYAVHDVAFRVVGTGSVGTRSYVALLIDHRGEPLILQVKEARPSALVPHLSRLRQLNIVGTQSVITAPPVEGERAGDAAAIAERSEFRARTTDGELGGSTDLVAGGTRLIEVAGLGVGNSGGRFDRPDPDLIEAHEGRRVVLGQKRMQVVSDPLLGWTTIEERPYQVRQFRNRKGSVDPVALAPNELDDYARMTGALLARGHAHSVDPRLIAGYCGKSEELDEAIASFATIYSDRAEADHAELVSAVRSGRIPAEEGV